MTQDKDNALLPCPEYEKWFFSARSPDKDMPYATHLIYQVCDNDEKKFEIAEGIMRAAFIAGMNTRANVPKPEAVDVEELKQSVLTKDYPNGLSEQQAGKILGWNECIDFLASRNLLKGGTNDGK
jgi:hypothetical protein